MNLSDYEVIVSDDSANSNASLMIEKEFNWVKWVEGPKKGPAANRNNGAKFANGEWLLFIDDDCLPDADIIRVYCNAISEFPDVVAFEGKIYVDKPQTSFLQEAPLNYSGGLFWSCNICIRKDAFVLLGGFDEGFPFPAMEDVDFFKRLREKTTDYRFLGEAAVMHPWRTNTQLIATTLKRYKAQQYYILKHPDERKTINTRYYLSAFLHHLLFTCRNAGKFRFSGVFAKFYCDFLQLYFGLRTLLAKAYSD